MAMLKKTVKNILIACRLQKSYLYWALANGRYLKNTISGMRGKYPRECPICGYKGFFHAFGTPPVLMQNARNAALWKDTGCFCCWTGNAIY